MRNYLGTFLIVLALSGCTDGPFTSIDNDFEADAALVNVSDSKLRHPHLLSRASAVAGKDAADASHVFVGFNEYESDGVTRRLTDSYSVSRRILEEYGVSRRVLEQYGISRRVLEEYGISRRVLESYSVTRRVLESYGITAQVLEDNNYQVSQGLLREFGTSTKDIAAQGISRRVLEDYGVTRRVLSDFGVSDAAFDAALASWERSLRLKVRIDSARPGIFLALGELPLATFLDEVSDDSEIAFVELDLSIQGPSVGRIDRTPTGHELVPWGVERIGALLSNSNPEPVHVFLLDSGVYENDLNLVERKDFSMLFVNRDQTTWDDSEALNMPYFDPGTSGNPEDGTGHGTHLAGTIGAKQNGHNVVGAAALVQIHSLKVMSDLGQTDVTTLLSAIDYVIAQKLANPTQPMLINMSLGMNIETTAYNVLDEGVKRATENGITVVVSAGNDAADASTYSPAHVAEAITVGSYGASDTFSSFSNFGPAVDLLAPGEMIPSLSNDPRDVTANFAVLDNGTSMAAAHVTGAAALLLAEQPSLSPANLMAALIGRATSDIGGAPAGTTDRSVWAGPSQPDGDGGSAGTGPALPPFYSFAITSGNRVDVYQETSLWTGFEDPNASGNASVFANQFLDLDNNYSRINGFAYNGDTYAPSGDVEDPDPATWETWVDDVVQPNYNPSDLPGVISVDPIDIPYLDVDTFKGMATRVSSKNLTLRGHYELGTADNPMVWYVKGNVVTREDVTFSGYGVFLVKGTITINNSITHANGKLETTLGLYANNGISFKSDNLVVAAHVFTNSGVLIQRDMTLYGNITAKGNVSWKTQGPNQIFYREPPRVLTDIFWPVD